MPAGLAAAGTFAGTAGGGAAIGGGLAAGGSIISGLIGSNAAERAGQIQKQAGQDALAHIKGVYQVAEQNAQPYINFGKSAVQSLSQLYGLGPEGAGGVNKGWEAFTNLPAYQFPLQQGLLALTRNMNAQGLNLSGAHAKEAEQYGQGLASQYMMSNYVNPLQQFANLGAQTGTALGAQGAQYANLGSQAIMGAGQGEASGIVGSANALSGGIGNAVNSLAYYSRLARSPMNNGTDSGSNPNSLSSYQPLPYMGGGGNGWGGTVGLGGK